MPEAGDAPAEGSSAALRRVLRLRQAGEPHEAVAALRAEVDPAEPLALRLHLRLLYEVQDHAGLQSAARLALAELTPEFVEAVSADDLVTLLRCAQGTALPGAALAGALATISRTGRRDAELGMVRRAAHHRLRFRKTLGERYAGHASIVSLGHNCLPWHLPGPWGLRREEDAAALLVPFSLAGHTADGVVNAIAGDFAEYCTPDVLRVIKTLRGHELPMRKDRTAHWNHNRGTYWLKDGCAALVANMVAKAQAFRDACRRPDVVFLMATSPVEYPQEPLDFLPRLQAALARHTGTERNRILITNQAARRPGPAFHRVDATVGFAYCPYPAKDYVWHDDEMAETAAGIAFERSYVGRLLRALLMWGLLERLPAAASDDVPDAA